MGASWLKFEPRFAGCFPETREGQLAMNDQIKIQLVKLTEGGRLLRFSEKVSGLCLEKRLGAQRPVVLQKARLLREFQDLLALFRLLASAILLLPCLTTFGQDFQWAIGTQGFARGVAADGDGSIFLVGQVNGSNTPLAGLTLTNTGFSMFIAKLNREGNAVWAKPQLATVAYGHAIAVDFQGNTFVVGEFSGSATFGSTTLQTTNGGYGDAFIAKFDSLGNPLWARSAGGTLTDIAYAVAVDGSGNCFVVGEFYSTNIVIGGTTLTNASVSPATRTDCFVAKYSSAGDLMWAKPFGGEEDERLDGVSALLTGEVFVAGRFASSNITVGSISLTNSRVPSSQPSADVLVAKLDTNGEVIWAASAGGSGSDVAFSVAADTNGFSYVSGFFSLTSTFGTNVISTNVHDVLFLAKYDPFGNCVWVRNGGVFGGEPRVAVDLAGDPFVAAYFSGAFAHGSTTLTNSGGAGFDVLVAKYLADGTPAWALKAGGHEDHRVRSLAVDKLGNTILAGYYSGTNMAFGTTILTNFQPTSVANPLDALFVAKIAPPISVSGEFVGSDFRLGIFGTAGRSFRVLSSTNLNVWTEIGTFPGQAFREEYTDINAATGFRRFFRVRVP
jgi:hypothetical protein